MDFNEKDLKGYGSNYSESGLWDKIVATAGTAGQKVIYAALLLYYVLVSDEVPFKYKSIIIGALGYFILPLDLISDFIPVAGYTDDLAALIAAIKAVSSSITPAIRARAQAKLASWFPSIDDDVIRNVDNLED